MVNIKVTKIKIKYNHKLINNIVLPLVILEPVLSMINKIINKIIIIRVCRIAVEALTYNQIKPYLLKVKVNYLVNFRIREGIHKEVKVKVLRKLQWRQVKAMVNIFLRIRKEQVLVIILRIIRVINLVQVLIVNQLQLGVEMKRKWLWKRLNLLLVLVLNLLKGKFKE